MNAVAACRRSLARRLVGARPDARADRRRACCCCCSSSCRRAPQRQPRRRSSRCSTLAARRLRRVPRRATPSARCSTACSCTTASPCSSRCCSAAIAVARRAAVVGLRQAHAHRPAPSTTRCCCRRRIGMIVMAASNDLITIFLGLELMSLALYVLVGLPPQPARVERGGAQVLPARRVRERASCSTASRCSTAPPAPRTSRASAAFLGDSPLRRQPAAARRRRCSCWSASLFKVAAVPFHMWTPDAYEGAPTTVTALHVGRAPRPPASPRCCASAAASRWPTLRRDWTPLLSRDRDAHDDGRQRHRAAAEQPQAHARLLEHRARRLRAGRGGRGGHRRRLAPRCSTSRSTRS